MSNKLIFTNTLALYLRLLITLFVSLFTTRIVLKNLGVEDYGLYGTVAGIIALIAFLQNALSGATNRFFNVEMVDNDIKHIQRLFTTSVFLHICIAVFICLALEIVGMIGLKYYIHLPDGKLAVANNVLHLSIVSLFVLILTIPFEALLIAKENFKAYALISIFETLAKLAVAYSLVFFAIDRLVYYAFGLLLATVLTRLTFVLVTKHLYQEVSLKRGIDKGFVKQIFSFVSWDLYGNFAVILRVHGITLIMNNFFGLIMVASIQVGNQVLAALSSFSSNFLIATRPQLMKSYINNDFKRMNELTIYSAKYSYLLMLILCVPIITNINYILKLWLVNPPKYAVEISIFSIISTLVSIVFLPLTTLIHATGNIKRISFWTGTLIIVTIPIVYFLLKSGFSYYIVYLLLIIFNILAGFMNLYITKIQIPNFEAKLFISKVLSNIGILSILIFIIFNSFSKILSVDNVISLIIYSFLEMMITLLLIYLFSIERKHKLMFFNLLKNKLNMR